MEGQASFSSTCCAPPICPAHVHSARSFSPQAPPSAPAAASQLSAARSSFPEEDEEGALSDPLCSGSFLALVQAVPYHPLPRVS